MVTYQQARDAALARMSDKSWFNLCTEYDNAFVFSKYDDFSFGGYGSPCAVMKAGGECCSFSAVLDEVGDVVRYSLMASDGRLTEVSEERLDELQSALA